MILHPPLPGDTLPPGSYSFWCGRDCLVEARGVLRILNSFLQGVALRVSLYPSETPGATWIGEDYQVAAPLVGEMGLELFTSGTTGLPKGIFKPDMKGYIQRKRGTGSPEEIWLLAYQPHRWAGISVLTHALKHGCGIAVPHSLEVADIIAELPSATHASMTPSLFRKILLNLPSRTLDGWKLSQLTFGGEPVSQQVLDEARDLFPGARITHTYASTEHSDIASASDGLAGFPARKFTEDPGMFLDESGELHILGNPTGDLWEIRDGRCFFKGRVNDVVNVGGAKIALHAVEEAALTVPGVLQAIARAEPNPMMGHIVTMKYIGPCEPRTLMREMRARLPKYACPATVEQIFDIVLTETGKRKV